MDAVVGLGSNLGDRRETLASAVAALAELGQVAAVSPLYETEPVGPPQPRYLNAAVRLHTDLGPEALLARMRELEHRAGRERRERWRARTLDLDLLWIDGVRVELPALTVPHPRLHERAFALLPLLDVAPAAADPESGIQYARIAPELDASGVWIIESREWWRPAKIQRSVPH